MNTTHLRQTPWRKRTLGAGLLAAGLALTACGSSTSSTGSGQHDMGSMTPSATTPSATTPNATTPSATSSATGGAPATGPHNKADITFAQQMVPHHEQAVTMSRTLLGRPGIDPRVTALAREIEAAQGPEITQMTGWLTGWGAAPATGMDHGSMGGSGDGMAGMMSDADMSKLAAAEGPAADRLFLTGMIMHHRGAVEMARQELTAGSNPQAKALAQSIITSQEREIATMTTLLPR